MLKILLLSSLIVAMLGVLYVGLMYAWIDATGSLDPPDYVDARNAIRQFFYGSILALILVWMLNFVPLKNWCGRSRTFRAYLMSVGALMTAAGVVGMLVVLPVWGELSGTGGVTPDYGHTLTYHNLTGAMWLFFLGGVAPYSIGYFAVPGRKPGVATAVLLVLAAVPIYAIGYAVYLALRQITAP